MVAWLALVGTAPAWATAALARPTRVQARAQTPPTVAYQPPVRAPITDPFRPPLTPYGPGNRGIDYATVPGTAVRAAGDGVVVFAGPVAGGLHVTVLHGDGLRTSYSFLAAIRVTRGQRMRGGDPVGDAAGRLHVGARRGEVYIDPASLWGTPIGPPAVHLVPLDGHQPAARAGPLRRPVERSPATSPAGLGAASGAARGIGRHIP